MFNGMGIKIVDGLAIDFGAGALDFANDHGMVLVNCCPSIPSLAISGDALFCLLPDPTRHGASITTLMYEGIRAVVPMSIDV